MITPGRSRLTILDTWVSTRSGNRPATTSSPCLDQAGPSMNSVVAVATRLPSLPRRWESFSPPVSTRSFIRLTRLCTRTSEGARRGDREKRVPPGADQACGWPMLTIQGMPNLSTHIPNSSPHICFSKGTDTVPPSDSFSQ